MRRRCSSRGSARNASNVASSTSATRGVFDAPFGVRKMRGISPTVRTGRLGPQALAIHGVGHRGQCPPPPTRPFRLLGAKYGVHHGPYRMIANADVAMHGAALAVQERFAVGH